MKRSITHSLVWWMLPFLLAVFILPHLRAQSAGAEITLPEGVTKVASVEGITEYLLESNGLRFLLFSDPSNWNWSRNTSVSFRAPIAN